MYIHPLYHWPPKSLWTARQKETRVWGDFSAYVHFPFCRNICTFCGYETRLISKPSAKRVETKLISEIDSYRTYDDFSRSKLRSIFFGGGTASLLTTKTINDCIEGLRSLGKATSDTPEITLECEPGTITRDKLREIRLSGVNRVSICAQSFNNDELRKLTRRHSAEDSLQLIEMAIDAGFENLHVDLIYGQVDQRLGDWMQTVDFVSSLPINHVSIYKLYVYTHGFLDRTGALPRASNESLQHTQRVQEMYDYAIGVLENSGFQQYTLTEFAKPSSRSVYIADTFRGGDVLPIGPSSFGRCGAELWRNSSLVESYDNLEEWSGLRECHHLNRAESFKRDVILGLWMLEVDLAEIAIKNSVAPSPDLISKIESLSEDDLLNYSNDQIISVEPRQRFNIGIAMKILADFPSSKWLIDDIDKHEDYDGVALSTKIAVIGSELLSILRVARRDPQFFKELNDDPRRYLDSLNKEFSPDQVDAMVDVIRGAKLQKSKFHDNLAREWALVCGEQNGRLPPSS